MGIINFSLCAHSKYSYFFFNTKERKLKKIQHLMAVSSVLTLIKVSLAATVFEQKRH